MTQEHDDSSLHEILSAICDETATAEQIDRLAERLRSDAAARRFYVRYLDMHGRLNTLPGLGNVAADKAHAGRAPAWRRPAVWGGFAAAVAVAAFLLGGRMRRPEPPEQAAAAIRPYVATVIDAGPAALLNGRPATPGGRLGPARFHLTDGSCTLRFDGGAQLFFDQDARFAIVSRNAVHVDQAAFTFRGDVTCEAISITTPRSTLVDVGTEYTAVVKPGSEDLHVVDGKVRRTPSSGSSAAELLPAKTSRSYAGREGGGRAIEFDPSLAARNAAITVNPSRAGVAPLAHDRFDTDALRIGQADGGTGWKSPWISHDGLPEFAIVHPGLGLGGKPSGAIAHAGDGPAAAHRYLASPIDLGTDGVWYVRYLVRRPAARPNDPNIAMLVLRTYGRTAEEEIERQSALHLAVYQADTLAVKFAGQSVRSAVPQPAGETFAVVAKIVAGRTQPDQVFACVLPASRLGDREPLEWSVATDCLTTDHVFDQVSVEIISGGEVLFGDIAIGTSWATIAANPDAAP